MHYGDADGYCLKNFDFSVKNLIDLYHLDACNEWIHPLSSKIRSGSDLCPPTNFLLLLYRDCFIILSSSAETYFGFLCSFIQSDNELLFSFVSAASSFVPLKNIGVNK
ncbi:hypothetical protein PVAP13_3KG381727 [Panicum virgatum]|uniref:Uncharacterized protein n=1 Tax=Panicum virgatum TaxID=38727 RepID=A0A8T0V4B3_PANVG|nr:hypothetical protein PVAP13_3KG381727 [Panicum virgatum]